LIFKDLRSLYDKNYNPKMIKYFKNTAPKDFKIQKNSGNSIQIIFHLNQINPDNNRSMLYQSKVRY